MTNAAAAGVELELPPRYQLQSILKETPAIAVYLVIDACTNGEAALKILRRAITDPQQIARFKLEFATLASIDHPNIVKVFEFGLLHDRLPFFTMEFFRGRKITDFFDGGNWEALYGVIAQVASALHHIHHAGIIHLDIKPTNLLVDDEGNAKLMDFGVAVESRRILDRQIRGTLQYMAPEVLRQDRIDSRADLYSLGMTLYETVTGVLPGYGMPAIDVIRMQLDEPVKRPSSINPRVPAPLEQIIMKLLEKDPRQRYSSAAAVMDDVARASDAQHPAGASLAGRGELFAAPLIGRSEQVGQLARIIAEAREARGSGVIVAGGEGMGKSRIVRDATLRAQLDGARVFCGRCPVNRKTVYAPFFQIFEQLIHAVNPDANANEELRRILRSAVTLSSDAVPPQHGQKYRLFTRVIQSMQDLYGFLTAGRETGGSPLIIVIEDLQWADAATAELFTFLAAEAKQNRLVVIGTLTYEGAGEASIDTPPPSAFWESRAADARIPIIRVERLTEPLVREHLEALLGSSEIDDELVRWMLWESSGSPLNIRRVVDYLVAHRFLTWEHGHWSADMERIRGLRIPGGPASIVAERLDALTHEERCVLEAAAVVGEVAPVDLVAKICDPAPDAFAIVNTLTTRSLLDESNDGRTVSFPRIHLRDAVYTAIAEPRRSELHLRVAEALEPLVSSAPAQLTGQVAYHFARANEIERGVKYSIEAGDLATRTLAHEEATEFYRAALELMDLGGAEEARKAAVREKLADAYYRRDDYRSAMHSYQFLLKSIQSRNRDTHPNPDAARVMKKIGKVLGKRGDQDAALTYFQNALHIYDELAQKVDVAELLNRIAWLYRDKGDFAAARASAQRAEEILEPLGTSVVYGYVKNMLGVIEFSCGNWPKSKQILLDALAMSERLHSDQLRKIVSTNLGNTLWKLGEWEKASQFFRKNLEISEAEGDLWDLISAYNNMGVVEYGRAHFEKAADYFEKSVRIDEKIGALEYEALAQENLADALEMLGRWPEALQHYQRCLSLEGFDESRAGRISVYVPLARLMLKKGDIARALEYGQKALHAAERARDEDLAAEASYVLALIEEERENYAEAGEHLARALSIFTANETLQGLARAHTAAARLALHRGEIDSAVDHAKLGSDYSARLGDRYSAAVNDWVWGKVLYFLGERDSAASRFDAAREAFEDMQTPYELARLTFDVGLLREEPEEATKTIRDAIRIFERLDATHDLERARGALFRIRPAGKPEQNVVGLYEIVKIINSSLDLEEVLNRVLDVCIRRLRAERGMIILLDPITSALRTRVARNIREPLDSEDKRSPQSIIKDVIQTGQPIMSADARADERFSESESVVAEHILSILCVPLIIKNRSAGAIYVDHRQARQLFSQKDLSFLEAFADQAAIAIENARLYEELEEARTRLSLENETLRREVLVDKHLDSVVGNSEAVAKIQFAIRKAAAGSSTVLLRGESGTGKGLVARIIHNISPRRNGPFIKFNCAALPETLAESELFGHERGAFTGADRRKLGRFELANGGTIFLDEIGKTTLAMQAKLLRVVEDKEFERVGGTQTIKTDVKIISATNLDLERAIHDGTFREDLYYRLNIVPLVLPPLRERKEDIPILAEYFIRKICKDLGIEMKRLEPGVIDLFLRYHWPGNIRELEAALHRAIVMSNGNTITRSDFHGSLADASASLAPPAASAIGGVDITSEVYEEVMASVDRQLIVRALEASGGRIREAARRLGLARNTLKAKILKYNIAVKD